MRVFTKTASAYLRKSNLKPNNWFELVVELIELLPASLFNLSQFSIFSSLSPPSMICCCLNLLLFDLVLVCRVVLCTLPYIQVLEVCPKSSVQGFVEPRLSIFFNRLSRAWAVEPNMLSPEERISY